MLHVDNIELYYGASQALRGVSLTAEPGQVTCVMGRNGVGKTSLLRAIVGQQPIQAGAIHWQDREITKMPGYRRARAGIAYVPQGREIFPLLTVEENLRSGFAALPRGQRTLPEDIFDLFPVLRDMLGRRGGDLSGGQQQQLAIARALVMRPRLLVLDEPTEGIQPSIIKDIQKVIALLRDRGNMAIILVEQYFEFARDLADRFAVMERGEVVLSGARNEMVESDVRGYLTV
jgi:urea transport system ATP-binding protein